MIKDVVVWALIAAVIAVIAVVLNGGVEVHTTTDVRVGGMSWRISK